MSPRPAAGSPRSSARPLPIASIVEAANMRAGIAAAAGADYDLALIDLAFRTDRVWKYCAVLRLVRPETICVVTNGHRRRRP